MLYGIKLEGGPKVGYRQHDRRDPRSLILRQIDGFLTSVEGHHRSESGKQPWPEGKRLPFSPGAGRTENRPKGEPWEVESAIEAVAQPRTWRRPHGAGLAYHAAHPFPEWSGAESGAFPFFLASIKAAWSISSVQSVLEMDDPLELFPITYYQL
jgi:hypothetical protein